MNATTYNPIFKAIKLAYVELTAPEAVQWYQDTAYQTYLVVGTLVTLAVCLVQNWLLEPFEFVSMEYDLNVLALPASPVIGLLMPAKDYKPTVYRLKSHPAALPAFAFPASSVVHSIVRNIMPTLEYSGGGAATSCQGYLFYRR